MTTTTSTPADDLLAAVRTATRRPVVDQAAIDKALDAFAEATDGDISDVRAAAREIVRRHKQGLGYGGNLGGPRMAAQYLWQLAIAADQVGQTWERHDELAAAEQELAQREQGHRDALAALEQAVKSGDVDRVMKLRGEVEVKHPTRIAEARTAVLELRIEQARARQGGGAERGARARRLLTEAQERHNQLAAQIAQAAEDINLARLEHSEGMQAAARLDSEASALQAELSTLKTTHEREMQARLRRIAGLPEPEVESTPEDRQVLVLGTTVRADAHDFTPSTAGSL
ncbi:hypothetical protein [Micromonospora sp. C41]|uniref:hypothetical protein n=1 Tax=Micromonospora sp. C41 TaxID=2824878 RepID=UPI001B39237F|nr:hypothetical protein [Micromonospora sp. C41]MBQ1060052.1 hypothetical protein [Micromonospora sp. C41]